MVTHAGDVQVDMGVRSNVSWQGHGVGTGMEGQDTVACGPS